MLKNYKRFLKISFLWLGGQLCGSAPAPGASNISIFTKLLTVPGTVAASYETETSLWGPVITSPQVNENDMPIGHHAIADDTASPKSLAYSPPAMLPMPTPKTPQKSGTDFWDDHDSAVREIVTYKQAVNHELNLLKQALEENGFDFDNTAGEFVPSSPRDKIKLMKERVQQVEAVEEIMTQTTTVKVWPAENVAIVGPCVTSARKCFDLMGELSANSFARTVLGASALAGAGVLIKKKLSN